MRGKGATPPLEVGLLALAERQHSLVARGQLCRLGFSGDQIDRRIQRGWLRPVHRGVYLVGGGRPTREAMWMAATLALGDGGALSHRSAAELWALIPGCSSPIHVTVPTDGGRKRRKGLAIHRGHLEAEVTRRRNFRSPNPRGR